MDENKEKVVTESPPPKLDSLKPPAPFFMMLKKKQRTNRYVSYDGSEDDYPAKDTVLKELQTLMKASNEDGYNELVNRFSDRMFRRTKGQVYEMFDENKICEVQVAVQVKNHSLTWYFWAPGLMDQYPQEFRDILYDSAAVAHKRVNRGCDLYYRGSNSVHVKLMHHLENESGHNHNHYRLVDNTPYTPNDFNEHMDALKDTPAYKQFFQEGEIEELKMKFAKFHESWYHKPEGGLSKHERYMQDPSQRLNAGDVIELMLFGHQQEPCRISPKELQVDYNAARKLIESELEQQDLPDHKVMSLKEKLAEIEEQYTKLLEYRKKGGSRGLFSEIASTRQTYQSALEPIPYVGGQHGSFGTPPEIPDWAIKLKQLAAKGEEQMIVTRAESEVMEQSKSTEAKSNFAREMPERVIKDNMKRGATFFVTKDESVTEENIEPTEKKTL